jgi:hypothetical protein
LKQHFLETNNLFNPSEYFGGLNITNLSDSQGDERLEEMFYDYLPTEQEERIDLGKIFENNYNFAKESTRENKENGSNTNEPLHIKEFSTSNQNIQKNTFLKKSIKASSTSILSSTLQPNIISNKLKKAQNSKENTLSINKSNVLNLAPEISGASTPSTFKLKDMFNLTSSTGSNFKARLDSKSSQRKTPDSTNSHFKTEKSLESDRVIKNFETNSLRQSQDIKNSFRSLLNPSSVRKPTKSTNAAQKNKSLVHDTQKNKSLALGGEKKGSLKNSFVDKHFSPRVDLDKINLNQKLENYRAKSKSSERGLNSTKERKFDKNFSSFTQNTLQDEEYDTIYKSYNLMPRPRTANPSFVEEHQTPLIKGIVSPKIAKTPNMTYIKPASAKECGGTEEKKVTHSNPLKFLNDFIQKTKITHSSSSNHLKMPKTSTFSESKPQILSRGNSKNKQENRELKNTVKNSLIQQGVNPHNYTSFQSAKRLFGNKPSK